MRKVIKAPRARAGILAGVRVRFYRAGDVLSPEQHANLLFRDDLLAQVRGEMAPVFRSHEERRLAWREHGHRFRDVTQPGTRVAAFWAYEPGVPDELRAVGDRYSSREAEIAAHHRLGEARRRWLLENPRHLRPGEREILTAQLGAPQPRPSEPVA